MEIFYPANRFLNFYIVPLLIERREPTSRRRLSAAALAKADDSGQPAPTIPATAEEVGHAIILRDITESRRSAEKTMSRNGSMR